MTPLLSVRDLSVAYGRDRQNVQALNGVSFDLSRGERLAVIGESGSGKSTLALALGGLLPHEARLSGKIDWPGLATKPRNGKDLGFVFQDPAGSLDPVQRIGDQIGEVLRTQLRLDGDSALQRSIELLASVRLPEPTAIARAYPHQLSGGQKQRVAIACALAAQPSLLVADEATSALDTIVQADIVALIDKLVRDSGLALLFITHDIALASQIGDRIAVFRDGSLIEIGLAEKIVSAPAQSYTRELIDAHLELPWSPTATEKSHA